MEIIKIKSKEHLAELIAVFDGNGYHMASDCAIPRYFLISADGFYSLHSGVYEYV